ncbi:response regulator [Candidatus Margulisiibacteriota bacterium]
MDELAPKTKILIADDEPNILKLTSVVFRDMGLDVHQAVNGQEAVQKAQEIQPDIVIVDVIMPEKDGFEVVKTIRNTPPIADIPIIILSALGDEYNKITGFEGGADDYVTKPFNVEELKARVKTLLARHKIRKKDLIHPQETKENNITKSELGIELIPTGFKALDECLHGGLPKGSNVLVIGPLGSGKSSFSRKFVTNGLMNNQRSLFVALDDAPRQIRSQLNLNLNTPLSHYEDIGMIRFVDAYSWSSLAPMENESFAIDGVLELNQLSGIISDASYELGQTIQNKMGGLRIIDSISSLLINFELPSVQRFINQIGRTAIAFGGVTTLFIMEEGTVSDQVLNNIKYIMDGILEFAEIDGQKSVKVASMKWAKFNGRWNTLQ